MVYEYDDIDVDRSSFALSRGQLQELIENPNAPPGELDNAIEKKRNRLAERIFRGIFDVHAFHKSGLLDSDQWDQDRDELLETFNEYWESSPPVEGADENLYRLGKAHGETLSLLYDNGETHSQRDLIVGIVDGLLDPRYITPESQKDLAVIKSALDELFGGHEFDVEQVRKDLARRRKQKEIDFEKLEELGLQDTSAVALLALTKSKLENITETEVIANELLEETKLGPFEELSEYLMSDTKAIEDVYSGKKVNLPETLCIFRELENQSQTEPIEISGLEDLESSPQQNITSKDIAAEKWGISYNNNVGNVLRRASETEGEAPWNDRPLIKLNTGRQASYDLTNYGELVSLFHSNYSDRIRKRLHWLAWYDYQKTSETVSDMKPESLLDGDYEKELELVEKAVDEILE
ncbi:hypothetical protein ACFQJ7_05935 [Halovenus rubra]|uniref:Uncharacterized protein n=2 Tax=Halovenus rubra TaxID=869890 RepID=A0ABD5X6P0_9EURY|nr:hypothetical protein [Halovenus rubra]